MIFGRGRSWSDKRISMAKRDEEHYEIARRFGVDRPFTRLEFNRLYRQEYPKRISVPIPSDYCVNLHQKGRRTFAEIPTLAWPRAVSIYRRVGLLQFKLRHYRRGTGPAVCACPISSPNVRFPAALRLIDRSAVPPAPILCQGVGSKVGSIIGWCALCRR